MVSVGLCTVRFRCSLMGLFTCCAVRSSCHNWQGSTAISSECSDLTRSESPVRKNWRKTRQSLSLSIGRIFCHLLGVVCISRVAYTDSVVNELYRLSDRLCRLVVTVPGYRSRGPGFDSRRYQIFWEVMALEGGSLSLVRIHEELLEWKVAAPVLETVIDGRRDLSRWPCDTSRSAKVDTNIRRPAAVVSRYSLHITVICNFMRVRSKINIVSTPDWRFLKLFSFTQESQWERKREAAVLFVLLEPFVALPPDPISKPELGNVEIKINSTSSAVERTVLLPLRNMQFTLSLPT
jgi:hypothetical protein